MEPEQIAMGIQAASVLTAALAAGILIWAGRSFHPGRAVAAVYRRVDRRLHRQRGGWFQYDAIDAFLTAHGAAFHYGAWMDPVKYLAVKMVSAAVAFALGLGIHPLLGTLAVAAGWQLPGVLLKRMNSQDNRKMTAQLESLYNSLSMQIEAGIHVTDALVECHRSLPRGRLRQGLEELSSDLFVHSSFGEAVDRFQKKFGNGFIDSLCIILKQAQESGQAVDPLRDMADQIKDMEAALLLRKKEELNRFTTVCIIVVFAAAIAVILYACVTYILGAAGQL